MSDEAGGRAMSEYVPNTEHVRDAYVRAMRNAFIASAGEHEAEFDRWLERVRAEERERCAQIDPELLEIEMWRHRPVLSMKDGSIRGCQCSDNVFINEVEDWGSHLADAVIAHLAAIRAVSEQEEHHG